MTWYSFCSSWVLSGASYSLLTLTGQQLNPNPDSGLCLLQAIMIYTAPTLTASAALALVIHLRLSLRSMLSDESAKTEWREIGLVALPYIMALVVLSVSLANGISNRSQVQKSYIGAYCVIETGIPGSLVASWVAVATFVGAAMEIFIAYTLYRNWRTFRQFGARSSQSLTILIRVGVFTLFDILALVVSLVLFAAPNTPLHDIILAILAVASLLIFGSQKDLARAWMFWKVAQPDTNSPVPRSVEVGKVG